MDGENHGKPNPLKNGMIWGVSFPLFLVGNTHQMYTIKSTLPPLFPWVVGVATLMIWGNLFPKVGKQPDPRRLDEAQFVDGGMLPC